MITAVLDTNALASGFVRANPAAAPAQLIDAWHARRYTLVTSDYILDEELPRTLSLPYFQERVGRAEIEAFLLLLRSESAVTPLTVVVEGVATHPEDDHILATAVSAGADYLVTGDRQLQQLGRYQGVTIVSPRQFAELLATEQEEQL